MHRILLIDDEAPLRRALTRLLQRAGYDVRTAADGCAGIRQFRASGADLVITDMMMPDCNGIEVVLAIRHAPHPAPVIAMSGGEQSARLDLLGDAKLLGALALLQKPFTGDELLASVRAALERQAQGEGSVS